MKMLNTIPALPVKDMGRSVAYYLDKLHFTLIHREDSFAILHRDAVDIHLWAATDESWRERGGEPPIVSGAESFIAGTASCRIGVQGVNELYQIYQPLGILHPNGEITDTPWGTREFGVLDPDNNLITFYQPL